MTTSVNTPFERNMVWTLTDELVGSQYESDLPTQPIELVRRKVGFDRQEQLMFFEGHMID